MNGTSPTALARKFATLASDIKLSHTVFAMPFALLSAFVASDGWPKAGKLALILVCMVAARTLAMICNRLFDASLDARNPRTAQRAMPSRALSGAFVIVVAAACASVFITATAMFLFLYHNRWPLILSVPVLLFLSVYPLLKRFTRMCHYYLGAALALAPICAWVAITGQLALPPLWMAAAVLAWTAGFDIIYACQDYQSDLQTGVFSLPAKIGVANAMWVARTTHVFSAAMLIVLGLNTDRLGTYYFTGVGMVSVLLIVEHVIVGPKNLSRVNVAFFTINGIISLLLGSLGIVDVLRR